MRTLLLAVGLITVIGTGMFMLAKAGPRPPVAIADTLDNDMVLSVYDASADKNTLTVTYSYNYSADPAALRTIRFADNFARVEVLDSDNRPLIGYSFALEGDRADAGLLLPEIALTVSRDLNGKRPITFECTAGGQQQTIRFGSMAAFDRAVALFTASRDTEFDRSLTTAEQELLLKAEKMHRWAAYFTRPIAPVDITAGPQLARSEQFRSWLAEKRGAAAADRVQSIGAAFCDWVDVSRNLCAVFEKDEAVVCGLIRATQMVCEEFPEIRAEEE